MSQNISIKELFKGAESTLEDVVIMLSEGRLPKDVAEEVIRPKLDILEANAGTQLDPTFVAYGVLSGIINARIRK